MTRKEENIDAVVTVEETPAIEESIRKPNKVVGFVALQTTKVYCNKSFDLIEGQKIPKDLPKEFITSLINSKIIKEV